MKVECLKIDECSILLDKGAVILLDFVKEGGHRNLCFSRETCQAHSRVIAEMGNNEQFFFRKGIGCHGLTSNVIQNKLEENDIYFILIL